MTSLDRHALILISVNNSVGQNTTLEDITKELIPSMPADLKIDTNNYALVGYPAIKVEFTANIPHPIMGETEMKSIGLITIIDGRGYLIGASAPDTEFSDYAPIFGHMINSFNVDERL